MSIFWSGTFWYEHLQIVVWSTTTSVKDDVVQVKDTL